MIFINYNDIYEEYINKDDEVDYKVVVKNATTPIYIVKDNILSIEPLTTATGRIYKNVSVIRDRSDKIYKVVGNYKEIIDRKNRRVVIKGFR